MLWPPNQTAKQPRREVDAPNLQKVPNSDCVIATPGQANLQTGRRLRSNLHEVVFRKNRRAFELIARRFHLREWRRPTEYGSKKATAEEKGVAEITKRFEALPTSSSHRPDSSTRARGAATKTTPEKELTRRNCARSAGSINLGPLPKERGPNLSPHPPNPPRLGPLFPQSNMARSGRQVLMLAPTTLAHFSSHQHRKERYKQR